MYSERTKSKNRVSHRNPQRRIVQKTNQKHLPSFNLSKNYEFIKNTLLPIFRKEFDRELKVYRGKNSFECVITEKQFYKEFREVCEFPGNRHQQYWDVPQIIKHSPREIKKWFVTGFFDAEGTVYPKKAEKTQKPKIVFYSSWYERDKCPPLEFIRNFLNEIGIKTGNVNGPIQNNSGIFLRACN